jgi:hypothetical protein
MSTTEVDLAKGTEITTPPPETSAETSESPSGRPPNATYSFTNADAPKDDFMKIVPEDYREKAWVQNLAKSADPIKETFKQYEEAQKLIGARPQGIIPPTDKSTPEEIASFNKAIGVPDDIKQYVIETPAWAEDEKPIGEIIEKTRRNDVLDEMRKVAKEQGITPKQFTNSIKAFEKAQVKVLKDIQKAQVDDIVKRDKEFQDAIDKKYGAQWTNKVAAAKELINKFGPEEWRKQLPNADNAYGLGLLEFAANMHDNFVKGDTFTGTKGENSGIVNPGKTMEDVRQETRELMAKPEYTDPTHPNNKATVAKVKKLQDSLETFLKR